jgi:hypothetical protein
MPPVYERSMDQAISGSQSMGLLPIVHGVSQLDSIHCSGIRSFEKPARVHGFRFVLDADFSLLRCYSNVCLLIRTKMLVTYCLVAWK